MIKLTQDQIEELLDELKDEGNVDEMGVEDVLFAAQYSDTMGQVLDRLLGWLKDMQIEAQCDSKAAAWFEDAAYGYPEES
jgi:chemotaxis regulatin CheY-phosphate phosphatase CheZ